MQLSRTGHERSPACWGGLQRKRKMQQT